MITKSEIFEKRAQYSQNRILELRNRIAGLKEPKDLRNLTIFVAGSHARLEASEHSDIDVFFFCSGNRNTRKEPHTKELKLFGKMIEIAGDMKFPKFSDDCRYLQVLHTNEMFTHLGSPIDDHGNYFTARMLLLLESKCLYGDRAYDQIISKIVDSYFRDYADHRQDFEPIFLLNDICRYWKTLLLNYEYARTYMTPEKKTKQKVRNFKLKFSRMTTCFASIAALGSYANPVMKRQVIRLTRLTPRERLEDIVARLPRTKTTVTNILKQYAWFLGMTGLRKDELEEYFRKPRNRSMINQKANDYGDSMFELLCKVSDSNNNINKLLRYLAI